MRQYLADGVGLWCQLFSPPRDEMRPAVFLDRDGVLVEEVNFLHRIEHCRLIDGAIQFVFECNQRGIPVIIVTNQSGIGRGYYRWADFHGVQIELQEKLAGGGAQVDMVLACAYHGEGIEPYAVPSHSWRKPMPGMFQEAQKSLNLCLDNSIVIGDRATDLLAGKNAGLRHGILVKTGYGKGQLVDATRLSGPNFDVSISRSIAEVREHVPYL